MGGVGDEMYLCPLYATVPSEQDGFLALGRPTEPVPKWFLSLLYTGEPHFHVLLVGAQDLDDWGSRLTLLIIEPARSGSKTCMLPGKASMPPSPAAMSSSTSPPSDWGQPMPWPASSNSGTSETSLHLNTLNPPPHSEGAALNEPEAGLNTKGRVMILGPAPIWHCYIFCQGLNPKVYHGGGPCMCYTIQ